MEYDPVKKEIKLGRELSNLDKFVLKFTGILTKHADYVIVSGYVAILLGRSRATEDIDLLVSEMSFEKFNALWKDLDNHGFECINTSKPQEAFDMLKEHAIRFCIKNIAIPNIELKAVKDPDQEYTLKKRIKVILDEDTLYISPPEMQIAYKLDLGKEGNEKDLEDAKHLYELFKDKLDKQEFARLIKKFKAEKELEVIK
jgi:hypothetical protein